MTLWLVGGLDPTGGAGVARDRSVAAELRPMLEVVTVITALTEQGDGRPARARPTPPERLRLALASIADAGAIKIGLVPAVGVDEVAAALVVRRAPCVLDPVLRASDGGDMGASLDGVRRLARHADVVTPNRAEALALFGDVPTDGAALIEMCARLGAGAVLMKDVPGADDAWVVDRLVSGGRCVEFRRPRRAGPDPRGTGCALATAIACAMATGHGIEDACGSAIAWLDVARTRTRTGPDGKPHLVPGSAP